MNCPVSYNDVFEVNKHNFNEIAIEIFRYQSANNTVYKNYLKHIGFDNDSVTHFTEIPYLPIELFKGHKILTGTGNNSELIYFESSSTTGKNTSKHFVPDMMWYKKSYLTGFVLKYGNIHDWCILALLPNYLENKHSSLITMVDDLIKRSRNQNSGYFLDDAIGLKNQIIDNESKGIKTLIFGVSFALLNFNDVFDTPLQHVTIIETGGMKGRQKEITRSELHTYILAAFPGAKVDSEYGMTELFSQAYMTNNVSFETPPWMHVSLSELEDPFTQAKAGKAGLIRVIDLANINSCSFIATSDVGKMHKDDSFEVLGRYDYSEQRGCNLLIA